jgi:hypothetical protein
MTHPGGRPAYYNKAMTRRLVHISDDLWETARVKAKELTDRAGKKITMSDLVRKALERLLKEI